MITLGRKPAVLVVGGRPRADLLPPEIKAGERARAQRRQFIGLLAAIIVLVAGGYVGASFLAQSAAAKLTAENAETAKLLQEQVKYAEVTRANQGIAAAETARVAAMATEIDWKTEIAAVVATLPDGAQLTSLTVTSTTPLAPVAAPSSPLEGSRVAELQLAVSTNDIVDTAKWIRELSTLTGFVDATPSTIAATDGDVTTALVLHLNDAVYWNRFAPEASK